MKHLKYFSLFEAVIMPNKIESNFQISSIEDAIEYGRQNNFDVVGYDEFYNSLTEADKRNAPRRGVPFFALFHPERKKPMFVACDPMVFRFMPMKEIIDDIIGHELVHFEQSRRKGDIDYSLPNPVDKKSYFSNKEEVMAFSWTIANELSKQTRTVSDAFNLLKSGFRGQSFQIWSDIKRNCDEKTINRYKKYIYMYLEKMFDNEYVKPEVSPFKELDDKAKSIKHGKDKKSEKEDIKPFGQFDKKYKYESPEDLEKIGFKRMPQEERVNIIMDIIDNSPSPSKFSSYFSPEDIQLIKSRMKFRI